MAEFDCKRGCGKRLFWVNEQQEEAKKQTDPIWKAYEVDTKKPHDCPNVRKRGFTPKAPIKYVEIAKGKDAVNTFIKDGWEPWQNGVAWSEALQEFLFVVVKR